jgi:hypothetical protein
MKDAYRFNRLAKLLVVPCAFTVLCLATGVLFSGRALAFNTGAPVIGANAPQLGSANKVGGGDRQPWFVIGNTNGAYDGNKILLKIYVPNNRVATLHIYHQGNGTDGQRCGGLDFGDSSANYKIYRTFPDESRDTPVGDPVTIGDTSCADKQATLPINVPASSIKGHSGYRVFQFEADKVGLNIGDNERAFRLEVTMNDGNSPGGLIGMVRSERDVVTKKFIDKPFGVDMRDLGTDLSNNDPKWNFAVQFAPQCDDTDMPAQNNVLIHDVDKNLYGQDNLSASLFDANDSGYNWGSAVYKIPGDADWTLNTPGNPHPDSYLKFSPDNNSRYLIEFHNFSWKNAIQFLLPYDQFDAQQSVRDLCNTTASLSCAVNGVDPDSPYYGQRATISVQVRSSVAVGNYFYLQQNASNGLTLAQDLVSGHNPYLFDAVGGTNVTRGSPTITYRYVIYARSGTIYNSGSVDKVMGRCGPVSVTWQFPTPVKPYFQIKGGDVFTGGWFTDNNNSSYCKNPSNYQAPTFDTASSSVSNGQKGGIYAFAGFDRGIHVGASSQYAAFATGMIHGSTDDSDDTLQYGFYTYGASIPIQQQQKTLSFANSSDYLDSSDSWGGLFEGSSQQTHCAPDYYGYSKDLAPKAVPASISSGTNDTYFSNNGSTVTINGGSIGAGKKVTIFVNGNVYIGGNITYPAAYSDSEVPKFALVVRGNIYIDPNVAQLDGLYVAQPNPSNIGSTGVIWTCHDGSATAYTAAQVNSLCKNKPNPNSPSLTFNGSVIAKQMNLWRVNDGLNAGTTGNPAGNPGTPAEVFNYIPAMVVGTPFFNSGQTYTVESVKTMPPVY